MPTIEPLREKWTTSFTNQSNPTNKATRKMLQKSKMFTGSSLCMPWSDKQIDWPLESFGIFPPNSDVKVCFRQLFAAKIYPIFTILFTLKYIRDQKLNNIFLIDRMMEISSIVPKYMMLLIIIDVISSSVVRMSHRNSTYFIS